MANTQSEKAELFRKQHHDKKLLLLPNIWDVLSARLIAALGYPSLATASAAMSLLNGYADGEHIPFKVLIDQVRQIVRAVDLPVSVDLERGFADHPDDLRDNIKQLLDAGAIGLNIEDGKHRGKFITPLVEQCRKIEAVREAGIKYGVPIVINARTDLFMNPEQENKVQLAIERAKAYQAAGADCFYPILINNYNDLASLLEQISIPVNAVLIQPVSDLRRLEDMGVARVSVGPTLLRVALAKMKAAAEGLLNYNSDAFFDQESLSTDFLGKLI